jgi:sugar phosphate permease
MIGNIVSCGMLAAAVCKLTVGQWIDREKPVKPFFVSGLLVIITTVAIAIGGYTSWFIGSIAHRAAQTLGWPTLTKWVSLSESVANRNRILGYCSMSWILGDALARLTHGALLQYGISWRWNFVFAASFVSVGLLGIVLASRQVSSNVDFVDDIFEPSGTELQNTPWKGSPFWGALGLSVALSLSREAVMEWMPTYLVNARLLQVGAASMVSAIIPIGAAGGALYLGKTYFRLPGVRRPKSFLTFVVIASAIFMLIPSARHSLPMMAACLSLIGVTLGGAYATLLGEVASSIGGKSKVATTTSIIDGIGSVGGILAGRGIAELVTSLGWTMVWSSLGALCLLSGIGWLIADKDDRQVLP